MVNIQAFIIALLFCLSSSCINSSNPALLKILETEKELTAKHKDNKVSTYEYLSSMVQLACDKNLVRFSQKKHLLVRSPKWVSSLHPMPGNKLKQQTIEAYSQGQVGESEYEGLQEQLNSLRQQWLRQRSQLTKERFKLGYQR